MPATGLLTVRVYTSAAQLPIAGAAVTITQETKNGSRLLASRITDESGKITPVRVDTPELSGSLSPGTNNPFAIVNVLVDHPDYERVLIENVQLFPGILTQQNVDLLPISVQPEAWNMTEIIYITKQEL